MNEKIRLITILSFTASVFLVSCGGDDSASESGETNPIATEATAPKVAKKKATAKKNTRSVMDRIDDALDRENYMGAVDIAIKSGKTASENMSNLRYVQEELGDPMAQGDKKAHEAYKKLNAFFMMKHQR